MVHGNRYHTNVHYLYGENPSHTKYNHTNGGYRVELVQIIILFLRYTISIIMYLVTVLWLGHKVSSFFENFITISTSDFSPVLKKKTELTYKTFYTGEKFLLL